MGRIDYRKIYETNQDEWKALTREPQKYEALLAGHYSDSNHFVYELLQNAEDESATKVVIEYYSDRLVFYHDGSPFNEDDVRGVSSMLMGTKDRNDAQTIGRFGMGFKSVFKYTYQPEIYSDEEAFIIKNYLLPVESEDKWDFQKEKSTLAYPDSLNTKYYPFSNSQHLTKIVIPFKKRNGKGELVSVNGGDVLDKLNSLSGEILLFLSHIRNLYWIDKRLNRYVHITLSNAHGDDQLLTCRNTSFKYSGGEVSVSHFLRYKKVFDHPEMKSAEVSVAYKLNAQAKNINEMLHTPVWVYFPTRDMTDLPFLIHGSFETAVSREKLMTPSSFNNYLFEKLGDLIAESMLDLAKRGLITQVFLRRVVLAAFQDETKNGTIRGLKDKITRTFLKEKILPDRNGTYYRREDLVIAVPFQMAEFKDSVLWSDSFTGINHFVAFNNEKERNFTEYFSWLRDDLAIQVFDLSDWSMRLHMLPIQSISLSEKYIISLRSFYGFISDYRESLYRTNLTYSRGGSYEQAIRSCLPKVWAVLRKAPVILNAENDLVPAYVGEELSIYLNASSRYRTLRPESIVSTLVSKEYETLFKDGFQIAEFDNYQFIKEKIIKKYINGVDEGIQFEDDENFEREYIEDVQQLLALIEESGKTTEVENLLKNAYIILIKSDDGSDAFSLPQDVYVDTSDEGIDLRTYYAPIPSMTIVDFDEDTGDPIYEDEDGESYSFNKYQIDRAFYEEAGISISKLKKLGLITTPVIEGERENLNGTGDGYWRALGEYCPNLSIDGFEENLVYIEQHPKSNLAKEKSVEIMKLLISISGKLSGYIRKRKHNPYDTQGKAEFLCEVSYHNWIFDKKGKLNNPSEMSRFELDQDIYSGLPNKKEAYLTLGFIEKEADTKADTFEMVGALDRRDKTIMFRQLAKELGYDISELNPVQETESENGTEMFDSNAWQSEEFPQRRVRNYDSLIEHVRQEFFCADPVKYEKVLRQIRTSKSVKTIRAYSLGMYVNESDTQICQMCKKPAAFVDVTEIANFGIEMPQLYLCFCKNCSSRYRIFRDRDKERFKMAMTKALREIDIETPADEYEISLSPEVSIYFTQTHLAEVKEILSLLYRYGIPGKDEYSNGGREQTANVPKSMTHKSNDNKRNSTNDQFRDKHSQPYKGYSSARTSYSSRYSNNSEKGNNSLHREDNSYDQNKASIGDRVQHWRFGDGVITEMDGLHIKVYFQKSGEKRFKQKDAFKNGYLTLI